MLLIRKLARFCAKTRAERWLIAEAAFYLAFARLLLLYLPFAKIAPRLAQQPAKAREADAVLRANVRGAVMTAARHVPWQAVCLPQAMAAKFMLARRGCTSTLRLGVGKNEVGDFLAHAWLEAGSTVVIGEASADRVTPIAQFR
jgi:hypothetical protein